MKHLLKKMHTTTENIVMNAKYTKDNFKLAIKQGVVASHNATITQFEMATFADHKVTAFASELNNVGLLFEPVPGMEHATAAYLPELHAITICMSADEVGKQATVAGVRWETYVDMVLAHEMGHAIDPTVEHYAALMGAEDTYLGQQRVFLEHALDLEINAERLGERFTTHKKAFAKFNSMNQAAYRGQLHAIRDHLKG